MEPSQREKGTIRTFTIEEANRLLPTITKMLEKAFILNQRIKSLTADAENLVSIWGRDVLERGHMDNAYYLSMVSERETAYKELIRRVNEIQALGCLVKDIEAGLVDFYYSYNGELVFLCWRYGEQRISHWHRTDGGFRNRSSINQLK